MAQPPPKKKKLINKILFLILWELTPGLLCPNTLQKTTNDILFQKSLELTPGPSSMAQPPTPPPKKLTNDIWYLSAIAPMYIEAK